MDDQTPLFLATVATATAAFVAIVGGLLVSRVVALATESSGLKHRYDDLTGQLKTERVRVAELEQRLLDADAAYVLRPKYEEIAKPAPDIELETWIAEEEVDRTAEEIQPYLDALLEHAVGARERLSVFFEDGVPEVEFDQLFSAAAQMPAGQRDLYEAVFEQLVEENSVPAKGPFGLDLPDFRVHIPQVLFTVHDAEEYWQLKRDLDESKHRAAAIQVQLEQTLTASARVTHPVGVRRGLGVLAYFAIVGAVVPLYLLLFADQLLDWTPFIVLASFASGLLALLGYVWWQLTHLTSDDDHAGRSTTRMSRSSWNFGERPPGGGAS